MSVATPSVLVLGAGSSGSRHAHDLQAAGAEVAIADPDDGTAPLGDGIRTVPYPLDRLDRYDGVVVASPTVFHAEQAQAALAAGAKVLIEKPMATTLADAALITDLARVMVGYNLRFHEPIQRLHDLTEQGRAGRVLGARFWFGSYLPDWRPHTDYRSSYSARQDLGGGVLLDAIHELDLVVWWFGGEVAVVASVVSRTGTLDIDVEDTVKALLVTPSRVPVELSLDYLSRRYRRGIEIVGTDATLRLDWARQLIEVEAAAGVEQLPAATEVRESYRLQARQFVAWLRGGAPPAVDGTTGLASLRLVDEIRAAAR